ncbi:MAG TPA: hypothetical protein VHI13_22675 [Candidatus Kapabacteria bacterium]|nr:hypothetical protein [Candidatus Kapabacteria bacterium]
MEYPNAPWKLWQLLDPGISAEDWQQAIYHALHALDGLPALNAGRDLTSLVDTILTERQFGPEHWRLSAIRRFYYSAIRPLLPVSLRPMLRRMFLSRQRNNAMLRWPIEDRYVRFQVEMLRYLIARRGVAELPYMALWPQGRRYAFVLTHDIESSVGQDFVCAVADLEERFGFRSAFNFVAEDYRVDRGLMHDLRERGFEIGVHGLKHDGKLFRSRKSFGEQATRINAYLREWGAAGFRSPFTHRHPDWMQALQAEYDSSFFDTDPFETIPGGTMSIWPFQLGRLTELPFTLSQDHTLVSTLAESTPRLWLDKIQFIERHSGMAMMITHPDYLRLPEFFGVYEKFLRVMSVRTGYWHALPRDVARWWRARGALPGIGLDEEGALKIFPEGSVGTIRVGDSRSDDDPFSTIVVRPGRAVVDLRNSSDLPMFSHILPAALLLGGLGFLA